MFLLKKYVCKNCHILLSIQKKIKMYNYSHVSVEGTINFPLQINHWYVQVLSDLLMWQFYRVILKQCTRS